MAKNPTQEQHPDHGEEEDQGEEPDSDALREPDLRDEVPLVADASPAVAEDASEEAAGSLVEVDVPPAVVDEEAVGGAG